jgi:hypothetical protein
MAASPADLTKPSLCSSMAKFEPNFFISPREMRRFPEDKVRNTPVSCKDEPLPVASLAMAFLSEQLTQEQKDALILEENKPQILPGKLQEKAKILSIRNQTLFLKTNSAVWRAELMAVKTNIVSSCNKILGKVAVKTLKIT